MTVRLQAASIIRHFKEIAGKPQRRKSCCVLRRNNRRNVYRNVAREAETYPRVKSGLKPGR